MKSPAPAWLARGLALLGLPLLAAAPETYPRLAVPAREVPVPSTVSPELQKLIATPIPPLTPMPTTVQGWKELQREADADGEKLARIILIRRLFTMRPRWSPTLPRREPFMPTSARLW